MNRRGIALMIGLAVAIAACDDDTPVAPSVDASAAKTGPNERTASPSGRPLA
jgi:hypothetical protein